eukprot:TRINITY_DN5184_c0_g1_i3.p2 TRINITY_DN5184_c0_g1~~TRINITY_DN5184_c0_g1_i3.p2  ORF type:complete len:182 (-),score=19.87 TRINITY_DN5184_c0_g1_i3:289-834(-)
MGQAYSQAPQAGDILVVNSPDADRSTTNDDFAQEIQEKADAILPVSPLIQVQSSMDYVWKEFAFVQQTQQQSNFVKTFVELFQCYREYVEDQIKKVKFNQDEVNREIATVYPKSKLTKSAIKTACDDLEESIQAVQKLQKVKKDVELLQKRVAAANSKFQILRDRQNIRHTEPHLTSQSSS